MESPVPEVARAIAALYGDEPLIARGVVHVCAAASGSDGRLRVLKIGDASPKSETDFFVLNLCRARADAILTTAANLRAEPDLSHALQGPWAEALAAYRAEALGKEAPLTCAILTRKADLPRTHPVWEDGTRKVILTIDAAVPALRQWLGDRAEVIALSGLDARRACSFLEERGHGLVSVEAGPSTASALYDAPSVVDELLLSVFDGRVVDGQLGGLLPDERRLLGDRRCVAAQRRSEASGAWRFQRWVRF